MVRINVVYCSKKTLYINHAIEYPKKNTLLEFWSSVLFKVQFRSTFLIVQFWSSFLLKENNKIFGPHFKKFTKSMIFFKEVHDFD